MKSTEGAEVKLLRQTTTTARPSSFVGRQGRDADQFVVLALLHSSIHRYGHGRGLGYNKLA